MTTLSSKGQQQLLDWKKEEAQRKEKGLPIDKEHRTCVSDERGDCKHLKAYLSWWCVNEDAAKYRGTKFPGIYNCPFWESRGKGIQSPIPQKEMIKSIDVFLKSILGILGFLLIGSIIILLIALLLL